MRSNPVQALLFYFSIRKYFTILFEILDFLRLPDRFKVHRKIFLEVSKESFQW